MSGNWSSVKVMLSLLKPCSLCLPFCFAAYNARDEDRETVEKILDMLEPYGRMDWTTLNRCIRFVWDCIDAPKSSVKLKNWRQLYDDEGLFLSYI